MYRTYHPSTRAVRVAPFDRRCIGVLKIVFFVIVGSPLSIPERVHMSAIVVCTSENTLKVV